MPKPKNPIDSPLSTETGQAMARTCYHRSALGSVMEITDMNEAEVVSYRYTPYGEVTITVGGTPQGSDPLGNPWMFTGRFLDEETGLYYYRARTYSPSMGRFLQRDPLGVAVDDCGLYCYAGSAPTVLLDPDGLRGVPVRPPPPPRPVSPGRLPWRNPSRRVPGGLPGHRPGMAPRPALPQPIRGPRPQDHPALAGPEPWTPQPAPAPSDGAPSTGSSEEQRQRGRCTAERHNELMAAQREACAKPSGNKKLFDDLNRRDLTPEQAADICADILQRIRNRKDCGKARQQVIDECFPGGDLGPEPGEGWVAEAERQSHLVNSDRQKYQRKCGKLNPQDKFDLDEYGWTHGPCGTPELRGWSRQPRGLLEADARSSGEARPCPKEEGP